jgi:hypothetical protein
MGHRIVKRRCHLNVEPTVRTRGNSHRRPQVAIQFQLRTNVIWIAAISVLHVTVWLVTRAGVTFICVWDSALYELDHPSRQLALELDLSLD